MSRLENHAMLRDAATNVFNLQHALLDKLDPVSRVTGIPGWYWIRGIKCSDTTRVGLVY